MVDPGNDFEQLIAEIHQIFLSRDWSWVNSASDDRLKSIFTSAYHLECMVKTMKKEDTNSLHMANIKINSWFEKQNRPAVCQFSDFEHSCDRLLTLFLTNHIISDVALSKAIDCYLSIFSHENFEKLVRKLIAQCEMVNAVLKLKNSCENQDKQIGYNRKILLEVCKLISQGVCSFPVASKMIKGMMTKDVISVEILLKFLTPLEKDSIPQLFISNTIFNKLKIVDGDYVKFWKLIPHLQDKTLVPKLAEMYPNFLAILDTFVKCCGDTIVCSLSTDLQLILDSNESILLHKDFIEFFKHLLNHKGPVAQHFHDVRETKHLTATNDESCTNIWIHGFSLLD